MPVFGPTRAALAAAAARGADILPSLRLVLTAEALTAPPPPRALELNAELDALCAAVRELADCRAGWLYFCPAYAPLPAAVARALLQGTVLTFLRGVLRSERRAAVRLAAQQGAAVLALQGQHRSTLLRRQPHGGAALTAQNSAQERQYGALQKRPGHGSGQRGVCRAEVQPPRTAVRQLPHGGAERVQLGVQLQCAGRRGRGQGFRRQHQPQRRQNVRPAGRRSRQRRACRAENRHEHSLTFCANSGVSLPRRKRFCAGNGWDFKISVDFLKNRVKRITDPLAEL